MLQVLNVSITIQKTPIQIPYPSASPELFDIGMFRPSITLSGIVPTVGGPDAGSPYMNAKSIDGQVYYEPYKNILEWMGSAWISSDIQTIELEIGNVGSGHDSTAGITSITAPFTTTGSTNTQSGAAHTGGAIYVVAFQSARFELRGAEEHLWDFTMQFVAKARSDIAFA
jgi:hypothetical protein